MMSNSNCFLCRFNTHKDASDMHQFILENVGHMHVGTMTAEVHRELQTSAPRSKSYGIRGW